MEYYLKKKKEEYQTKKSKKNLVNTLIKEYCLKRGQFNPKKPSPNLFCNKLEFRMKSYYNTLYTSIEPSFIRGCANNILRFIFNSDGFSEV